MKQCYGKTFSIHNQLLIKVVVVFALLTISIHAQMTWACANKDAQWKQRHQHVSVVFDNKIWVLKGFLSGMPVKDIWYSSDGVNWQLGADSTEWIMCIDFTCVEFTGSLWVIGGTRGC